MGRSTDVRESRSGGDADPRGQWLLLLAAWALACAFYWSNDGLWFQGDAPRHALNGLFYRDILLNGLSAPRAYAEQYYARYPAICPTYYPPVFYVLEAAGYAIVGSKWWVGKVLNMLAGLVLGGYLLVWLRRWVSPSAGWLAGLVVWSPGIAEWMNSAMLNVPATAFGMGALYHLRCALEAKDNAEESREITWALGLAVGGVLTHPVMGVVVLIGLSWLAILRRWSLLWNRRIWAVALLCLAVMVPVFYILLRFGGRLEQLSPTTFHWSRWNRWWFYPLIMERNCGWMTLLAAEAGTIVGVCSRRWRREVAIVGLEFLVFYLAISFIWAKSDRYALILCPATIVLVAILVEETNRAAQRCLSVGKARWLAGGLVATIAAGQFADFTAKPPENTAVMRDLAAYMKQVAPHEPVVYRGRYDGVFTFYVRLDDPAHQRQVVSLSRWMSEVAGGPTRLTTEERQANVARAMRDSGIRWYVSERSLKEQSSNSRSESSLSRQLPKDSFTLVRSFRSPELDQVQFDIYRLSGGKGKNADGQSNLADGPPVSIPRRIFGHKVEPLPSRLP